MRVMSRRLVSLIARRTAVVLVTITPGCAEASDARGRARSTVPAAQVDPQETIEKRLGVLDLDGAEALLDANPNLNGFQALRQRIAMARLDFEEAWRLSDSSSQASRDLEWVIAWYRDDLGSWAKLYPKRSADAPRLLAQFLTSVDRANLPPHRFAPLPGSARSVTIPSPRSKRSPLPYGIPCRLGSVETTAAVYAFLPVTLVDPATLPAAGWATITLSDSNGSIAIQTLVVPSEVAKGVGVAMGADLARYLNFSFDTTSLNATFSLDAPSKPPGATRVPIAWPLGAVPAMAVRLLTRESTYVDSVGIFWMNGSVEVNRKFAEQYVPGPLWMAGIGGMDAAVFEVDDGTALSVVPGLEAHALVGWAAFRGRKVTLGAAGRELWVE